MVEKLIKRQDFLAAADQSTGIAWIIGGSTQTTLNGNTSINYGTGQANTNAMKAQTDFTGGAAKVCDDYTNIETGTGVYNDWFLPSKDELDKLYINRVSIGGFAGDFPGDEYWSSSEGSAGGAWFQYFGNGSQNHGVKSDTYRVRAVRAF